MDQVMGELGGPTSLAILMAFGWLQWATVFGVCLRTRPLRTFYATPIGQRTVKRLAQYPAYSRIEAYCLKTAHKLSSSRLMCSIQSRLGVNPTHLIHSYVETELILTALLPVLLPLDLAVLEAYFKWASVSSTRIPKITEGEDYRWLHDMMFED